MIQIVILLSLFLLYAYVSLQKEGLQNFMPIVKKGKVYGVNIIKDNPEHIYNRLINPKDPLYQNKFTHFLRSDVILDMKYFNNASYLMQSYNSYI
jgi:hypothetical protein